jgi:Ca2+-binding EF-hand superfamily protein
MVAFVSTVFYLVVKACTTSKLQRLMTLPFIPSTSSINKLTQHTHKSKVHETATIRASEFKRIMENQTKPRPS